MSGFSLTLPQQAGRIENTDSPHVEKRLALLFGSAFFIGFLGWASLAPLDAGAYAHGFVEVAGNRQAVQPPQSGIVTALLVHEGSLVQRGQPLLRISTVDIEATEQGLTREYLTLLAERACLQAQVVGSQVVKAPAEFANLPATDKGLADDILQGQIAMLHARQATSHAQKSVLHQQSAQVNERISGLNIEASSNEEQKRLIEQELEGTRELAKKGFASKNRIRMLERAAAALEGESGSKRADIAASQQAIGQNRMQALVLDRDLIEQGNQRMAEVSAQLNDVLPRLITAREQLTRSIVRAPASGRVVGLSIFTVGGVVSTGQILMEIVPQDKELIIKAQLSPDDADDVLPGNPVHVRFPTLHDRRLPDVTGKVTNVSADILTDEKSGARYFALEVRVPQQQLERIAKIHYDRAPIRAGMPVEILASLQKRTMLDYLLEPVLNSFWRSGREH